MFACLQEENSSALPVWNLAGLQVLLETGYLIFSVAPRVFTRLEAAGKESVQSGFTSAIAGMQCVNAMFESV